MAHLGRAMRAPLNTVPAPNQVWLRPLEFAAQVFKSLVHHWLWGRGVLPEERSCPAEIQRRERLHDVLASHHTATIREQELVHGRRPQRIGISQAGGLLLSQRLEI